MLHGAGALASWAAGATPGAPVAVAGTGRGYTIDPAAHDLVVAGDETALAAIAVLLEALPQEATVRVLVEVADPSGRVDLPAHPGAAVTWCDLPAGAPPAARSCPRSRPSTSRPTCTCGPRARPPPCSGCVATSSRRAGCTRRQAVVRGYWKHGRAGDAGDASD